MIRRRFIAKSAFVALCFSLFILLFCVSDLAAQKATVNVKAPIVATDSVDAEEYASDDAENETDLQDDASEDGRTAFLNAEAVRASIDGAIDFLRSRQKKNGEWSEYPGYSPGTTALCALALLTAGLDSSDPTVSRALDYLDDIAPLQQNQTYPISLQTMAFCLADPMKYRENIKANVAWLIERQMKTQNEHRGGWTYVGNNQDSERADNSNSQFALLALYEAELVGIEIEDAVWKSAEDYWFRMQNADGSWGYRASPLNPPDFPSGYGTGSMTCAGIAALAICSGVREAARARLDGDGAVCCQEQEDETAARISRGLTWLGKHFSAQTNPGRSAASSSYFYYYLYGLERVGRLTANRFVGKSDWYREGAETLLRRKGALSNYWNAQKDFDNNNAITTSFALLFLSKGRWPILVSKAKYGDDDGWNEHPNDFARLTARVEQEWDQRMVWQTIDLRKSTLDDLLQTPILAINGTQSPLPKDPKERKRLVETLRGYLEQGGFIFAEAIDGDLSFETGFRELIAQTLPEGESSLRLLEPDHPIWTAEKRIRPAYLRPVYGADFGCRTSVVFVPAHRPRQGSSVASDRPSLSCLWEASAKRPRGVPVGAPPTEKALAEQEAAFELGVNICAYATNREMKFKDEISADVAQELERDKELTNSLFVGILECGAGSSCAPHAIPNLMKTIRSRLGVPTQGFVPRVSAKTDDVFDYPILFTHGRNDFTFSDEERERLREYFDRGGFLFVNAVCASETFETAFEREFAVLFPDEELVDVPPDDPLFTGKYGGFKIERLEYRRVARGEENAERGASSEAQAERPRLKGLAREGRWVLLFSRDDVSCALENSVAANCEGLTPKSAFYLATNILFYAAESF